MSSRKVGAVNSEITAGSGIPNLNVTSAEVGGVIQGSQIHAHTDSKINLVNVGGLLIDLMGHWLLLNGGRMWHVSAEFLPPTQMIVCEDLRV
jgi:hypothetical protein